MTFWVELLNSEDFFLHLAVTAGGVPSGGVRRQRIYPSLRSLLRAQLPRLSRNPPHWVHPLLAVGFFILKQI